MYSERWRNKRFEGDTWNIETTNSTGKPSKAKVMFTHGEAQDTKDLRTITTVDFKACGSDRYNCNVTVPKGVLDEVLLEVTWHSGALLTQRDMALVPPGKLGLFREDGFEYAAARAQGLLSSLTLTAEIPVEFCPELDDVQVYVEDSRNSPRRKIWS